MTTDDPQFTQRQLEVLALVHDGHANKEIALRLGIAERTVDWHLAHLKCVLGADSRADLVRLTIHGKLLTGGNRDQP